MAEIEKRGDGTRQELLFLSCSRGMLPPEGCVAARGSPWGSTARSSPLDGGRRRGAGEESRVRLHFPHSSYFLQSSLSLVQPCFGSLCFPFLLFSSSALQLFSLSVSHSSAALLLFFPPCILTTPLLRLYSSSALLSYLSRLLFSSSALLTVSSLHILCSTVLLF